MKDYTYFTVNLRETNYSIIFPPPHMITGGCLLADGNRTNGKHILKPALNQLNKL